MWGEGAGKGSNGGGAWCCGSPARVCVSVAEGSDLGSCSFFVFADVLLLCYFFFYMPFRFVFEYLFRREIKFFLRYLSLVYLQLATRLLFVFK